MFSKIILFALLFLSWFVFSNQTAPMYLAFGFISSLLTVWIVSKMKALYVPNVKITIIGYWAWLLGQVVKSAWDVTKRVWAFGLHIQPQFVVVDTVQKNNIGLTIYGNSITLTPGTVTVSVDAEKSKLVVHALTDAGVEDLKSGVMDKKVRKIC